MSVSVQVDDDRRNVGSGTMKVYPGGSPKKENEMTFSGDDHNLASLQTLNDMFNYSRIKSSMHCMYWIMYRFALVLYFPFGLILVLLRLFLMVVMGVMSTLVCIPRKWHTMILRAELLIFFGVWIKVKGESNCAKEIPLWVANHISELDAVVLRAISDPYILGYHFYKDMWWLKLSPLRLFKMIYVPQKSRTEGNATGRDDLNNRIRETLCDDKKNSTGESLLLFPEGGLTNGRVGLLQYHKFVFSLGLQVQPIALSLWSPLPIHVDTMYASFLNNVLCFLFVPCHCYKIEFLSPVSMDHEKNESPLDFARRVLRITADHLNIKASPFLYSDKKKWGKLRRELFKDGYKFRIVINELENHISVVNDKKFRKKKSKVQPITTTENIEDDKKISASVCEQPGVTVQNDKEMLLCRLYEAWQMTQLSFSHLAFAPMSSQCSSHHPGQNFTEAVP